MRLGLHAAAAWGAWATPALPLPTARRLQGVPWPSQDCPVLFINVDGQEQRTASSGGRRGDGHASDSDDGEASAGASAGGGGGGGASYCNPAEAEVALRALLRLVERDPDLQSVALLSPYRRAAAAARRRGQGSGAWAACRRPARLPRCPQPAGWPCPPAAHRTSPPPRPPAAARCAC